MGKARMSLLILECLGFHLPDSKSQASVMDVWVSAKDRVTAWLDLSPHDKPGVVMGPKYHHRNSGLAYLRLNSKHVTLFLIMIKIRRLLIEPDLLL